MKDRQLSVPDRDICSKDCPPMVGLGIVWVIAHRLLGYPPFSKAVIKVSRMQLKSKKVKVGSTTFVVSEIAAKDMLPLVQKLSEDANDPTTQMEIINKALFVDGKPVDAGELGMQAYMILMKEVMKINGMDAGDEGNA